MKRFSNVLSLFLTLLIALSATTVLAGTAAAKPAGRIICCSNNECIELQRFLTQYDSDSCSLSDLFKALGVCRHKNDRVTVKPQEQPARPTAEPAAPTEAQQPAQAPTETQEPVQSPTQQETAEFRSAYEAQVVALVNSERARYGLSALVSDDGAVSVAHIRAKEIVQSFSHTRPDGRSCFSAAADMGVAYRAAGENIAYGYATPQEVVDGWMNSEGHRKNILSSSFTEIGVGCYEYNGVLYWSQFFIG